ncbi:hypothetical protein AG1IA_06378 [Rhizoctonia solani AG-1 IA]|uniref:Uncharacterized protein n=1 Tax=Thanatephorus cucumeris (strain AG1-IA) TaxID=983506 RepID=L8WT85_THACA|nr:hypothetical protein AG1IA_06378 [Rhizoctonia solani AG-1 IA]
MQAKSRHRAGMKSIAKAEAQPTANNIIQSFVGLHYNKRRGITPADRKFDINHLRTATHNIALINELAFYKDEAWVRAGSIIIVACSVDWATSDRTSKVPHPRVRCYLLDFEKSSGPGSWGYRARLSTWPGIEVDHSLSFGVPALFRHELIDLGLTAAYEVLTAAEQISKPLTLVSTTHDPEREVFDQGFHILNKPKKKDCLRDNFGEYGLDSMSHTMIAPFKVAVPPITIQNSNIPYKPVLAALEIPVDPPSSCFPLAGLQSCFVDVIVGVGGLGNNHGELARTGICHSGAPFLILPTVITFAEEVLVHAPDLEPFNTYYLGRPSLATRVDGCDMALLPEPVPHRAPIHREPGVRCTRLDLLILCLILSLCRCEDFIPFPGASTLISIARLRLPEGFVDQVPSGKSLIIVQVSDTQDIGSAAYPRRSPGWNSLAPPSIKVIGASPPSVLQSGHANMMLFFAVVMISRLQLNLRSESICFTPRMPTSQLPPLSSPPIREKEKQVSGTVSTLSYYFGATVEDLGKDLAMYQDVPDDGTEMTKITEGPRCSCAKLKCAGHGFGCEPAVELEMGPMRPISSGMTGFAANEVAYLDRVVLVSPVIVEGRSREGV